MWTQNKTTIKDEANLCRADCIFIPPYATGSHATTKHFDGYYKLASDGSRYTLMVRDKTYFEESQGQSHREDVRSSMERP